MTSRTLQYLVLFIIHTVILWTLCTDYIFFWCVTFRIVQLADPSEMEKMFECRPSAQTLQRRGWLSWPSLPAALWDIGPCRKPEHRWSCLLLPVESIFSSVCGFNAHNAVEQKNTEFLQNKTWQQGVPSYFSMLVRKSKGCNVAHKSGEQYLTK